MLYLAVSKQRPLVVSIRGHELRVWRGEEPHTLIIDTDTPEHFTINSRAATKVEQVNRFNETVVMHGRHKLTICAARGDNYRQTRIRVQCYSNWHFAKVSQYQPA